MNFTNLRYFIMVAKEGNITKAAKKLYLSQQSLSEHINRLELEYGVKLFERAPNFHLTHAGLRLQQFAEQLLFLEGQMNQEMLDLANGVKGDLSVGITPVQGRFLLPEILPLFHERFPNIKLHITLDNSLPLSSQLEDGKLDVAILLESHTMGKPFVTAQKISDRFCIVIPESILQNCLKEGFTGENLTIDQLDMAALQKAPFLVSESGTSSRKMSDSCLANLGITSPDVLLEARDLEARFLLCAKGMGITFAYEVIASLWSKQYHQPNLLRHIIIEKAAAENAISICYHANRYLSNAACGFIEIAQQAIPPIS